MDFLRALGNYVKETQQATLAVVRECSRFRNDPEFFQKVCQVTSNCIRLTIIHCPKAAYLSKFTFVLTTANMHDFYGFLKQPRQWFFPINAAAIDENKVLISLKEELKNNVAVKLPANQVLGPNALINNNEFDADMDTFARSCLSDQLSQMAEKDDSYRDVVQFKKVLEKRVRGIESIKYDFSNINLKDVNITLNNQPLIERLENLTWTIVDFGCVGLYLQGWKLLDTAKLSEKIGQYRGFQWMKNQSLEQWVIGLVFIGFALKLFEACRKLHDEKLTAQDENQARWNRITSVAECFLWGTSFLNLIGKTSFSTSELCCFAIFAKSLGLFSIAARPKHEYFQQPLV